ncbi:hypothetical protein ACFP1Z_11090 [Streptomyces gamaensis]|uniref:Uncharacterized protein n=1 Tax=Streptomyces gamaensis TaxID=1763542 RepID=A0ABW0Z0Z6_9ACTN
MTASPVPLPDVPRTIGGIARWLRPELHDQFWEAVRAIHDDVSAGMLLDDWWRQAVIDTAGNDTTKRAALEDAADLQLIAWASEESDGSALTHAEAMAVVERAQAS